MQFIWGVGCALGFAAVVLLAAGFLIYPTDITIPQRAILVFVAIYCGLNAIILGFASEED